LQTIYAQQSAAALTDDTRGQLTVSVRALLRIAFVFWLALAVPGLIFAAPVAGVLRVNNPAALRVTMLTVLAVVWGPTLKGLLFGLHRFAPLGWLAIIEGIIRLGTFILLVKWLRGGAAGGVWAVFIGNYLIIALALWQTRDVWSAKTRALFSWRQWLARGAPLTLGMGAYVFMSAQADTMFVKSWFSNPANVRFYNCAMFIGFAMTQFIAPIASVMFPTIVRNLALSKKSDALVLTLAVTGGFACLAAAGCTLFPKLPLAILFQGQYGAAPLVPWYVWALVPLTLANVLIQNLLAQGRFAATPWLIAVPILYVLALATLKPWLLAQHDDFSAFKAIIQTMGFFCLLLFVVAGWFTWRKPANGASDPDSAGAR
jgi:O-antigen/teichoic acid export membrane protein